MRGHKRRFVSGYPSIYSLCTLHGRRSFFQSSFDRRDRHGFARIWIFDKRTVGTWSNGKRNARNIRTVGFYSEPARLLYDSPVNGKSALAEFRFPFHDVETQNIAKRKAQLYYCFSSVSPSYIYCLDLDSDGQSANQLNGTFLTYRGT